MTTKPRYAVGDRFIETTPNGNTFELTVMETDAEPRYPLPEDRPYLRLRRTKPGGREFVMSERIIDAVDWIVALPDETSRGSDAD